MTYILIVLLHYGQAGITAEFSSKEKCELAAQSINSINPYYPSYNKPMTVCVEK